jgi:hypothetical protein
MPPHPFSPKEIEMQSWRRSGDAVINDQFPSTFNREKTSENRGLNEEREQI